MMRETNKSDKKKNTIKKIYDASDNGTRAKNRKKKKSRAGRAGRTPSVNNKIMRRSKAMT